MAVVQISRIQNRRGRELTDVGIPQLASGEIGWAIDTQKMYIGNGAVAEGAPAVGNTEILTEFSDIFSLADTYTYRKTSNIWGSTTQHTQTLLSKLDQVTSVKDFGAVGDGLGTDDAPAFQAAIDALFIRAIVTADKAVLHVPPGEYFLQDTIYLPPLVSLKGAGVDKTILYNELDFTTESNDRKPMFRTVSGQAQPGVYTGFTEKTVPVTSAGTTQARHIYIEDMSINNNRSSEVFVLDECARSTFRNLKITGKWPSGQGSGFGGFDYGSASEADMCAFEFIGTGEAQCIENRFENIMVRNVYAVCRSTHDSNKNIFKNIDVNTVSVGFQWGRGNPTPDNVEGFRTGPSSNIIEDSRFDLVGQIGIEIENGNYNQIKNNYFYTVGNSSGVPAVDDVNPNSPTGFGSEGLAEYNIILFTNNFTNTSENNYFQRTSQLSPHRSSGDSTILDPFLNTNYIAEVGGKVTYTNTNQSEREIGYTVNDVGDDTVDIIKLPCYNDGTVTLHYQYEGERVNGSDPDLYIRQEGTMELHFLAGDAALQVSQDFTFQGDSAYSDPNFQFSARLDEIEPNPGQRSIVIQCKNLFPATTDKFNWYYSVRASNSTTDKNI